MATAKVAVDKSPLTCALLRLRAAMSEVVTADEEARRPALRGGGWVTVVGWPRPSAVSTHWPLPKERRARVEDAVAPRRGTHCRASGQGVATVARRLRSRQHNHIRRSGTEMADKEASRQRARRQAIAGAAERSIGGKRCGGTTTAGAATRQQQKSKSSF